MLRRKALEEFAAWRDEHGNRALLVTGARQVGKTYLVSEFLHAVYENAVAQELKAHGHDLHYFRNKKLGEVDFVCERGGGAVLPIEPEFPKNYDVAGTS